MKKCLKFLTVPVLTLSIGLSLSSSDIVAFASQGDMNVVSMSMDAQPAFSSYWYQSQDGKWHIQDGNGNMLKGVWVCDDAVESNKDNVWYLIDADGNMITSGLVKDSIGNYYSLETSNNGNNGMLRYKSGIYDGVYLDLEGTHNGSFAKIKNQDGVDALKVKYGERVFPIGDGSCVYTSKLSPISVNLGSSDNQNTSGSSQDNPSDTGNESSDNSGNYSGIDILSPEFLEYYRDNYVGDGSDPGIEWN